MDFVVFIAVISACCAASVITNKLSLPASITGGIISGAIFFGVGWLGIVLLGGFFLLGTMATSWRGKTKEQLGVAQANGGQRTTGQVLANAGVAGLAGIAAILFPAYKEMMALLMAAAFSSAAADTLSSELGTIYGKNFFDILSFKKGQRGADGVVSAEGFLCGAAGSLAIAFIFVAFKGWSTAFYFILITGTAGNIADSVLGATLERKGNLKNDAVNFFNTLLAALLMLVWQLA